MVTVVVVDFQAAAVACMTFFVCYYRPCSSDLAFSLLIFTAYIVAFPTKKEVKAHIYGSYHCSCLSFISITTKEYKINLWIILHARQVSLTCTYLLWHFNCTPFYGNLLKCPTSNYRWMILIMDDVFKCHDNNGAIYVVDKYGKDTPSLRWR